jgi:hypothetical protein
MIGSQELRIARLILVLIVAILGVHTPALAQLEAANEAGVSFGHWPAAVRDVEATKRFGSFWAENDPD